MTEEEKPKGPGGIGHWPLLFAEVERRVEQKKELLFQTSKVSISVVVKSAAVATY